MTTDPIVEKIKKLLRLGQSNNRAEAELAMQRAFELAGKHNVDVAGLDLDDEVRKLVHDYLKIGDRPGPIRKRVLSILLNYFNVQVVTDRDRACLIGTRSDVDIATHVYEFLVWSCQDALREFKRGNPRTKAAGRNSFVQGWMYGITGKLRKGREQLMVEESKTSLVLAEKARREAYSADLYPDTRPIQLDRTIRNKTALMQGYDKGKDVAINPALAGSDGRPKLLSPSAPSAKSADQLSLL